MPELEGGIKLKIYQIHELNTVCVLMLIDAFGSAFEYYLKMLVELGRCIKSIVIETITENEVVEKGVIFSKFISRWQTEIAKVYWETNFKLNGGNYDK